MNRRDFLKAVGLVAGAALTPAFVQSLPAEIPDTTRVAIGWLDAGRFREYASVAVATIHDEVVFPEFAGPGQRTITHVSVLGQIAPLTAPITISDGITPLFLAGNLSITEE